MAGVASSPRRGPVPRMIGVADSVAAPEAPVILRGSHSAAAQSGPKNAAAAAISSVASFREALTRLVEQAVKQYEQDLSSAVAAAVGEALRPVRDENKRLARTLQMLQAQVGSAGVGPELPQPHSTSPCCFLGSGEDHSSPSLDSSSRTATGRSDRAGPRSLSGNNDSGLPFEGSFGLVGPAATADREPSFTSSDGSLADDVPECSSCFATRAFANDYPPSDGDEERPDLADRGRGVSRWLFGNDDGESEDQIAADQRQRARASLDDDEPPALEVLGPPSAGLPCCSPTGRVCGLHKTICCCRGAGGGRSITNGLGASGVIAGGRHTGAQAPVANGTHRSLDPVTWSKAAVGRMQHKRPSCAGT